MARVLERSQSDNGQSQPMCREDFMPTKRASPASMNGFEVNHSHMNALVDPSFTEFMRPRMSLFTTQNFLLVKAHSGRQSQ